VASDHSSQAQWAVRGSGPGWIVDAEHEHLVWRHPRVHSYYNNRAGRVTTNAPWKLIDYWRMTKEPALDDFVADALQNDIGITTPISGICAAIN
jgi:hypothetical protein